jgi:hypothetical protein
VQPTASSLTGEPASEQPHRSEDNILNSVQNIVINDVIQTVLPNWRIICHNVKHLNKKIHVATNLSYYNYFRKILGSSTINPPFTVFGGKGEQKGFIYRNNICEEQNVKTNASCHLNLMYNFSLVRNDNYSKLNSLPRNEVITGALESVKMGKKPNFFARYRNPRNPSIYLTNTLWLCYS